MEPVTADELSNGPWWITAQEGWDYHVTSACCIAEDHVGHPGCEPEVWALVAARIKAGDLELIAGPELTTKGWQAVVRTVRPGYVKARFEWDLGGDARDVFTEEGTHYYVSAYRDGYGWIPKEFWPFTFNPDRAGRFGAPHPPFSMGGYWRGVVALPETEVEAANRLKDYLWGGGPMPEVDRIDEYKLLRYKAEADAIIAGNGGK